MLVHFIMNLKDSNLQQLFECGGVTIGHSVLQRGPVFPCLCPAAFSNLLHLDKEKALQKFPVVDGIPQNAAYMCGFDCQYKFCMLSCIMRPFYIEMPTVNYS